MQPTSSASATSASANSASSSSITVGVLALQGGFAEHLALLRRAAASFSSSPSSVPSLSISAIQVRTAAELSRCDALIIPGGESTTMSLVATSSGLVEPLREFVRSKPTWGTCAGLILLAQQAANPSPVPSSSSTPSPSSHQVLLGALDVRVRRNHFGRQAESFVAPLHLDFLPAPPSTAPSPNNNNNNNNNGSETQHRPPAFEAVFIRAPIVDKILTPPYTTTTTTSSTKRPPVIVLATVPHRSKTTSSSTTDSSSSTTNSTTDTSSSTTDSTTDTSHDIIAVRQAHVLGTSFHPELTSDPRMHAWFLSEFVLPYKSSTL